MYPEISPAVRAFFKWGLRKHTNIGLPLMYVLKTLTLVSKQVLYIVSAHTYTPTW